MTMDYVTFTQERIARLRSEADALERNLKEFQTAMARAQTPARRGGGEASGFSVVLEAISAAGPDGMTIDQMIEAAALKGFEVKRNTLRSQLWQAKEAERVIQLEPGRYASPRLAAPAEPEFDDVAYATSQRAQGSSVSDTFAPDQDDEIPF